MWLFSKDPLKDFGCEFSPQIVSEPAEFSFWKLTKGKHKASGNEVTIFSVDVKQGASETQLEYARTAAKKLKTLRHPSVLQFVDCAESDKAVYLATESCVPLHQYLFEQNEDISREQKNVSIGWGLFQILKGIEFLNHDGNTSHNNINISSIFVTSSGEWKLGGVEYTTPNKDGVTFPSKILPALERYNPPEMNDARKMKMITKWSGDMWGYGCLMWEVFNQRLDHPTSLKNFKSIPKSLQQTYCELVSANPSSRPNPSDVISKNRLSGAYFDDEKVKILLSLSDIHIMDAVEKSRLFKSITDFMGNYPPEVCKKKILPVLLHAFEFGNAGSSVLPPLLKIGTLLSDEEYQQKMVPCVIKLFSSSDRETRAKLLQEIHQFVPHLAASTINDHIFTNIANGFMDTNAYIREMTIKAILALSPKLNYKNLDEEVLKHFARLQARDPEGGIRANTTVCLGKIAPYLHPDTRQKVLISAFTRALKDHFPPARTAGVLALAATQSYFLLEDVATKILPSLCTLTMDPEKEVRDQVFRAVKTFLNKLEKVSEDPSLRQTYEAKVDSKTVDPASGGSTWTGWALNVFTSKFQKGQSPSPAGNMGEGKDAAEATQVPKSTSPVSDTLSTRTSEITKRTSEVSLSGSNKSQAPKDDSGWDLGDWNDESDSTQEEEIRIESEPAVGGWDAEEWPSIDEEPSQKRKTSAAAGTLDTGSYFSSSSGADPFFESSVPISKPRPARVENREDGTDGTVLSTEARRKPRSGALKLGAKRISGHAD